MQGLISYAYAYARAKAIESSLLNTSIIDQLVSAPDLQQIISILMETPYKEYISFYSTKYSGVELIEMSLNSHLVKISRIALNITPRIGLDALRSYVSKWDIANIKIIISSKVLGRKINETEMFLLSERDLPAGIVAGQITSEDFKIMIEEQDIDSIVKYLLKFPYGKVLMENMESFKKTGDPGQMLLSLDLFYFDNLIQKIKLFQGNEMPVLHLISSQIDSKNIMTLIRGIDMGISPPELRKYMVDGGNLKGQKLDDLLHASSINDIVDKVKDIYDLSKALEIYNESKDIKEFEIQLENYIINRNISSFRIASPGFASVIGLLLMFETERENIRKVAYGKQYKFSNERIKSMLIKVV
ncbi:MAG: V-type ATPase subunit [Thermoplasmata archaeon]